MSAIVNRPVRTAAQSTVAFALVEFIDAFLWNMDERQYGAAIAVLIIVLSGVQILIENFAGWGFLRNPDE